MKGLYVSQNSMQILAASASIFTANQHVRETRLRDFELRGTYMVTSSSLDQLRVRTLQFME